MASRTITVHGEAEKLAAIDRHMFSSELFPKRPPFESRPLQSEVPLPLGGRLTHFPLKHQGGSIGLRLDWPGRWLLVRPSNTEPIVRVIAEANSTDESQRLCDEATRALADIG